MKKIKLKNNFLLNLVASVLTSILLFFSFPPFGLWYFAFFSFIPLFLICRKKHFLNFFYGLLSGFIFYSLSLSWLKNVSGFIYLLLALYLSIYWAIFIFLIFSFDDRKIIFLGSCIWVFLEILMTNLLTGFPWLLLGLSQYRNYYILKIAKFSGILGISFILVGFNLFIYTFLKRTFSFQQIFFLLVTASFLFLTKIPEKKIFKGNLNIMLFQPNFLPSEIAIEENKKVIFSILKKSLDIKNVDILIFPEGTFQGNIFEDMDLLEKLKNISEENKCGILIGCFTGKEENLYNSGVFIEGDKIEIYNKIRLVPYGEFILGEKFKFIKKIFLKIAGYTPNLKKGKEFKVFKYKNIKFATLICYENIFPEMVEKFTKEGIDFFIVITNDSWFKNSLGPYQHFYHNVFRSIETGRYFLQAGLTGITGIINPDGKIEKIFEKNGEKLFASGILFSSLSIFVYETLYSKYGIYPFFLFCLILTGILICRK